MISILEMRENKARISRELEAAQVPPLSLNPPPPLFLSLSPPPPLPHLPSPPQPPCLLPSRRANLVVHLSTLNPDPEDTATYVPDPEDTATYVYWLWDYRQALQQALNRNKRLPLNSFARQWYLLTRNPKPRNPKPEARNPKPVSYKPRP
jgi:hypothetical protein